LSTEPSVTPSDSPSVSSSPSAMPSDSPSQSGEVSVKDMSQISYSLQYLCSNFISSSSVAFFLSLRSTIADKRAKYGSFRRTQCLKLSFINA
jgi:hypothetical protein